jgi:hypothetical protein
VWKGRLPWRVGTAISCPTAHFAHLARGESVIKCPSPLDVLKDTYDHSCY